MLTCDCKTATVYKIVLQEVLQHGWCASHLQAEGPSQALEQAWNPSVHSPCMPKSRHSYLTARNKLSATSFICSDSMGEAHVGTQQPHLHGSQ